MVIKGKWMVINQPVVQLLTNHWLLISMANGYSPSESAIHQSFMYFVRICQAKRETLRTLLLGLKARFRATADGAPWEIHLVNG